MSGDEGRRFGRWGKRLLTTRMAVIVALSAGVALGAAASIDGVLLRVVIGTVTFVALALQLDRVVEQ